jgi:membrane protease YdiL (CAAX protease family)
MSSLPPSSPGPPPARPELPEGVWRPPVPPGRPPEPPAPSTVGDALPRWPLWAPFAAILGTLIVALVGVGVLALIAEAAGVDTDGDTPGITIGGTYIQDLALVGVAFLIARRLDPPATAAKFGLRLPRGGLWRTVGWTGVAWAGFFAFSAIWAAALGITDNDDLPSELGVDDSTLALIAVAILVCVAAPIAEELFFRGFCFTSFRRTLGTLPAAVLVGIIFGAIHLGGTDIEFIVPLMVFGLFLCLLYVWTDSLVPSIVLHALNNALALGVSQDWGAATLLAMVGAAAAVYLITLPFARRPQGALA